MTVENSRVAPSRSHAWSSDASLGFGQVVALNEVAFGLGQDGAGELVLGSLGHDVEAE